MSKLGSARFLAGIAIIAAGAAWQAREHVQVPDAQLAPPQAQAAPCGVARDGLMHAHCGPISDDARAAQPATIKLRAPGKTWV